LTLTTKEKKKKLVSFVKKLRIADAIISSEMENSISINSKI